MGSTVTEPLAVELPKVPVSMTVWVVDTLNVAIANVVVFSPAPICIVEGNARSEDGEES